MLILADRWQQHIDREQQVKLALAPLGLGVSEPEEEWSGDPADDSNVDFDYSAVDWKQDASEDEWVRMQRAMANSEVRVSDSEVVVPEGPVVPDVDFDREWT